MGISLFTIYNVASNAINWVPVMGPLVRRALVERDLDVRIVNVSDNIHPIVSGLSYHLMADVAVTNNSHDKDYRFKGWKLALKRPKLFLWHQTIGEHSGQVWNPASLITEHTLERLQDVTFHVDFRADIASGDGKLKKADAILVLELAGQIRKIERKCRAIRIERDTIIEL